MLGGWKVGRWGGGGGKLGVGGGWKVGIWGWRWREAGGGRLVNFLSLSDVSTLCLVPPGDQHTRLTSDQDKRTCLAPTLSNKQRPPEGVAALSPAGRLEVRASL